MTLLLPSTDPPSFSESQLSVCLFRSLRLKADCRREALCSGGLHRQEPLPSVLGGFTIGLFDLDSGWASTRTILPVLSKPPPRRASKYSANWIINKHVSTSQKSMNSKMCYCRCSQGCTSPMMGCVLLLDGEIRNNSENYTFVPAPVTNNRAGYGHWFPGVGLKTKQFPDSNWFEFE